MERKIRIIPDPKGRRGSATDCALARALNRKTGDKWTVGNDGHAWREGRWGTTEWRARGLGGFVPALHDLGHTSRRPVTMVRVGGWKRKAATPVTAAGLFWWLWTYDAVLAIAAVVLPVLLIAGLALSRSRAAGGAGGGAASILPPAPAWADAYVPEPEASEPEPRERVAEDPPDKIIPAQPPAPAAAASEPVSDERGGGLSDREGPRPEPVSVPSDSLADMIPDTVPDGLDAYDPAAPVEVI